MANTSATKKTTDNTAKTTVEKSAVVNTAEDVVITKTKKELLRDDDVIVVTSLIPNVSYKDYKNNDFYEWEEVDHEEEMTYGQLKDMNRNYKSYFRDLWLKPMDDRVINAFGLTSSYKNYEDLMSGDIYTVDNIEVIKEKIETLPPRGIKSTIATKIKDMVASGEVSDIKVVKNLERILQIDLFDLLDL